uniref:Uncharacterized protein n=1 Tax=Physcomitrium patens TaxID=3218 RepID=A0A7I4AQP4_PHYPA
MGSTHCHLITRPLLLARLAAFGAGNVALFRAGIELFRGLMVRLAEVGRCSGCKCWWWWLMEPARRAGHAETLRYAEVLEKAVVEGECCRSATSSR